MKFNNFVFSRQALKICSTVFLVTSLISCASVESYKGYEGKKLPPEQVAVVKVPIQVDVLSIDGKKTHYVPFAYKRIEYHIKPGMHELVMQYEELWKEMNQDEDIISSPLFSVKLDVKAGHKYTLSYPPAANIEQARQFRESFEAVVVDDKDNSYRVATRLLDFAQQPRPLLTRLTSSGEPEKDDPQDSTPLDNLKFYWQQADAEQRQAFRDFIADSHK